MAEYTLHCFAQSGNSYKAALMLNVCGADWAPRFVDYFGAGETRSPAYRESLNVMGEAPVLEHGTTKLAQSGVILDWLACRFGRFGWANEDERREILRWLLWDNHKFTSYLATLRFLKCFAKDPDAGVMAFLQGRSTAAFGVLEAHLAGGREWVLGARPTIADFSLCGYLYYDGEIGVDWKDWPAIAAWLARLRALPGWAHPYALMPGHPLPGR